MLRYILMRILATIPVMGVVAVFVFLMLRLAPGDPAAVIAGDYATAEELAKKVQERLWAVGASGELGQFFVPVAYRKNVKGLIKSPVQFFWNMSVE